MTDRATRLESIRVAKGQTYAAMARELGVHRTWAWRLCHEPEAKVSDDLAPKLSAWSGGTLTVRELLYPSGLPEGAVMDRSDEAA